MNKAFVQALACFFVMLLLASCASKKTPSDADMVAETPMPELREVPDLPAGQTLGQAKSHWVPVRWADVPGLDADDLGDAWMAWVRNCERPVEPFAHLCSEIRRLSLASEGEQRTWMKMRFQPYRVQAKDGDNSGLLTSYYEPVMHASRTRKPGFETPLYALPPDMQNPWYTRQQMETLPQAQAELQEHAIAWLADPVDAMILQIQGSGRIRILESDGREHLTRLAYAGNNGQPYRSPNGWLVQQGLIADATWPSVKAWLQANPQRTQEYMWSNPRVIFFREEALAQEHAERGPKGAHGVPLTPGRSIAVDPQSIPYGTPVWLASAGPTADLQRLVFAQDTGSAIRGAVRADYFAGWGDEAGDFAGRIKQPLQLWVLWPRS